ncbi:MAG: prepilin-type N-terminal cleavage/methylation domain-containing protein [Negativicutes bacterium]|nr:prepilin-type N-terminal cleavage/methylation domain-containing protein [Negativicutes bacterium]
MSKSIWGQQGFSLTELIVGMALLTLMLAGIFLAISTTNTVNANTMNITQNVQAARDIMAHIYPEFENASNIETKANFAITCNLSDETPDTITYTKTTAIPSSISVDDQKKNIVITSGSTTKTIPVNGLQSLTIARDNIDRRIKITLIVNNGLRNTNYKLEENVVSLDPKISWTNTIP